MTNLTSPNKNYLHLAGLLFFYCVTIKKSSPLAAKRYVTLKLPLPQTVHPDESDAHMERVGGMSLSFFILLIVYVSVHLLPEIKRENNSTTVQHGK